MTEAQGGPPQGELEGQERSLMDKQLHAFADSVEDMALRALEPDEETRQATFHISERKYPELQVAIDPGSLRGIHPKDLLAIAVAMRVLISEAEKDMGTDFDDTNSEKSFATKWGERRGFSQWQLSKMLYLPEYSEDNQAARDLLTGLHRQGRTLQRREVDPDYNPNIDPKRNMKWELMGSAMKHLGDFARNISTPPLQ